jgi:DNA repair exonuclease SbcCD ATPase subunit
VFVKDGRDISLESKTATYELIEKTLMPKNVYHNIYYFTQQAKNFFTALPNTEQKEIFNSILDLSEYKDYYSNVKDCLTQSELKITSCASSIESTKET